MTLLPTLLVLTGAVTHAVWNILAKGATGSGLAFVGSYTLISGALMVPVTLVWLLVDPQTPQWSWLWAGAVSACCHLTYGLLLQASYAVGDLNLAYPVSRAVGPLVTLVVAVGLLHEHVGPVALAGALVLLVGVSVIAWPGPAAPGATGLLVPGLAFGVATGVAISSYTLWDDRAVNALDIPALPYYVVNGFVQMIVLGPFLLRDRDSLRKTLTAHWRTATVIAALVPFSYVIVLVAMTMAPVSLVAALRATSIVIASIAGWLFLHEPSPGRRLVGAGVVLVGVAAIALG